LLYTINRKHSQTKPGLRAKAYYPNLLKLCQHRLQVLSKSRCDPAPKT